MPRCPTCGAAGLVQDEDGRWVPDWTTWANGSDIDDERAMVACDSLQADIVWARWRRRHPEGIPERLLKSAARELAYLRRWFGLDDPPRDPVRAADAMAGIECGRCGHARWLCQCGEGDAG